MGNDIAVKTAERFPVLAGDLNLKEIVQANLGGGGASRFDLDRITIPAGGGTMWTVPSLEGPKGMASIKGIVLDCRQSRAYWSRPMEDSGGTEPDCRSNDSLTGQGDPGGPCESCPHSQWGSDPKGEGQACKLKQNMLVLPEDSVLPIALDLPPSSIREWRKFALQLVKYRRPFWSAVIAIGLKQVDKPVRHSVATFQVVTMLDEKETAAIVAYKDSLLSSMK